MIPFNNPYMTGNELPYIKEACSNRMLAGDGPFTKQCHQWLEEFTGCKKALLTHSCTAALEMTAILLNVQPGDEIIMPSYTFVSTANAFVLRGGVPVFVDIRNDTLNIDESLIKCAITPKTKAIVAVHYAGVACEMDTILDIAQKHGLIVIEDAAQGLGSSYKGRMLGSIGHLACLSFHETKNIISGEGGALLINDKTFTDRAEMIREKGTNRSKFFRGEVDKYTWMDIGSSYLPSEIIAAFLWAQLQKFESITEQRLKSWNLYNNFLQKISNSMAVHLPFIPEGCRHNAHMFYLLLPDLGSRTKFIKNMNNNGVNCVFHYVPLHSSPAGRIYGRTHGELKVTNDVSDRLIRLPLWTGMNDSTTNYVLSNTIDNF